MRENPYDRVVEKTQSRIEKVTDRIARNFKGTNPFDKEPIRDEDLISSVDMLTMDDMGYLIRQYGSDAINEFLGDIEQMKIKRGY